MSVATATVDLILVNGLMLQESDSLWSNWSILHHPGGVDVCDLNHCFIDL